MLEYSEIFNLQTRNQFISEVNNIAEDLGIVASSPVWVALIDLLQNINPIYVNKKITYHNFIHICYVAILSNRVATDLCLTIEEKRNLFIAAIFHDFGNTRGMLHDIYNISIAISYMNIFVGMLNNLFPLYLDTNIIKHLILQTSEVYYNDIENLLVGIIRDCDLTMTLSILSKQFALGMNNELNTNYYTHENMLTFAKSVNVHTSIIKDFLNTAN